MTSWNVVQRKVRILRLDLNPTSETWNNYLRIQWTIPGNTNIRSLPHATLGKKKNPLASEKYGFLQDYCNFFIEVWYKVFEIWWLI